MTKPRTLPPATPGPLLAWLYQTLQPMSRTSIKQLLQHGQIAVNGTSTTRFDYPLQAGDQVTVGPATHNTFTHTLLQAGIPVLHHDDALIVVNKPTGLLTVASAAEKTQTAFATLQAALLQHRAGRPFVVHRLDRGTSGVLLFARQEEVRDTLQTTWDTVEKTYYAVVEGQPPTPEGVVENYLTEGKDLHVRASKDERPNSQHAITHYRTLEQSATDAILEVRILTGRKHQIRVHLAGLGCPVLGDRQYGAKRDPLERLGLHAWRLAFTHPLTNERVTVEAPIPRVLRGG